MMINKEKLLSIGTTTLVTVSTLAGSCFADDAGNVVATSLTKTAADAVVSLGLILTPALSVFAFKWIAKQGVGMFKSTTK